MVCEDAQGNKFMVKAFNSSDNFLKLEEVTYLLIPFIQLECFNKIWKNAPVIQGPVRLRKLFNSFCSVISPGCISFALTDTCKQEIFRNCCCGKTGKLKVLYFIRASRPEAPNEERATGQWKF